MLPIFWLESADADLAAIILHCPDGPPELRENIGFSRTEMRHVLEESISRLALFCGEWERHHGPGRQNS